MANDIIVIDENKPINNESVICSTLPTGFYSKLLKRGYYSKELTIENLQSKYDERFDDPAYYFGLGNETVVGG